MTNHRHGPYDTLRVPPGKDVEAHLRHMMAFWAPASAPHELARACLAKIEALRRERDEARQRLAGRMQAETTDRAQDFARIKSIIDAGLDPDSLAAELEDAA